MICRVDGGLKNVIANKRADVFHRIPDRHDRYLRASISKVTEQCDGALTTRESPVLAELGALQVLPAFFTQRREYPECPGAKDCVH